MKSYLLELIQATLSSMGGGSKKYSNGHVENKRPINLIVIHPGYTLARHFNHLEAILELLKTEYSFRPHLLTCNAAVVACGIRSGLNHEPSDAVSKWNIPCQSCQRSLTRRMPKSQYQHIPYSSLLEFCDQAEIDEIMQKLGTVITDKELRSLKIREVVIGDLIIESIQRYTFSNAREDYSLIKGTVSYEFIKTAILLSVVSDKLFSAKFYDYVLACEVSYIDWGIPSRFAIKYRTKVLHQSHYYLGEQNLLLKKSEILEDLLRPPWAPRATELIRITQDDEIYRSYVDAGISKLDQWMSPASQENLSKLENYIDKEMKNVVVFTQLCWDASSSFSDLLHGSFESWIRATVLVALEQNNINWIFKIHPEESKYYNSTTHNTTQLLANLLKGRNNKNIHIMPGDAGISTLDLLPFIHAGITAVGTVAVELPSFGIPCLVAAKLGYGELPFVVSPKTTEEYKKVLFNILDIPPVSSEYRKLAQATFGLIHSHDRYINTSDLFRKCDSSDSRISRSRLNKWLLSIKWKGLNVDKRVRN